MDLCRFVVHMEPFLFDNPFFFHRGKDVDDRCRVADDWRRHRLWTRWFGPWWLAGMDQAGGGFHLAFDQMRGGGQCAVNALVDGNAIVG